MPLFDDLIINYIARYCNYTSIPALFVFAGKRHSIKEYYQLFGEIYPYRAFRINKSPEIISLSAEYSFWYAYNCEFRWGEGSDAERVIASSPEFALSYARYVLKNRWDINTENGKIAENSIISAPKYAKTYAITVIKGRFYEAEDSIIQYPYAFWEYIIYALKYWNIQDVKLLDAFEILISKNSYYAYSYAIISNTKWDIDTRLGKIAIQSIMNSAKDASSYALDILKGRWIEAEYIIMQDPVESIEYARCNIRGRWKGNSVIGDSAEKIIGTSSPKNAYYYALDILKGRWDEKYGEDTILTSAEYAYKYARNVINGRWGIGTAAEKVINASAKYSFYYAMNVIEGPWDRRHQISIDEEFSPDYKQFISKRR